MCCCCTIWLDPHLHPLFASPGPRLLSCRCTITAAPPSAPSTCPFLSAGQATVGCAALHGFVCAACPILLCIAACMLADVAGQQLRALLFPADSACCPGLCPCAVPTTVMMPLHAGCRQALQSPGRCAAAEGAGCSPRRQPLRAYQPITRRLAFRLLRIELDASSPACDNWAPP